MKIDSSLVFFVCFCWQFTEMFILKYISFEEGCTQRWSLVVVRTEDDHVIVLWPDVSISSSFA